MTLTGKILAALGFCLTTTLGQAAGLRSIEVAADAGGPALTGAMWSPCSQPPAQAQLGTFMLRGVKDCPIEGGKLPLVVISHGRGGNFAGLLGRIAGCRENSDAQCCDDDLPGTSHLSPAFHVVTSARPPPSDRDPRLSDR